MLSFSCEAPPLFLFLREAPPLARSSLGLGTCAASWRMWFSFAMLRLRSLATSTVCMASCKRSLLTSSLSSVSASRR